MKLFTEAGETANIGVVVVRTAINCKKTAEVIKLLICNFVGILLGELIAQLCGLEIPWPLFITIEALITVFLCFIIYKSIFRKQRVVMAFTPERECGSFHVNPCQILWASPKGDIPVFNKRGYKVRQVEDADGTHYVCIGRAGPAFFNAMQRLMPEERIWKCNKIVFEFGTQLEQYPEAVQILEAHSLHGSEGGRSCLTTTV